MLSQSLLYQWRHLKLASLSVLAFAIVLANDCALAQIVPDNTLGQESSVITPIGPNLDRIDNGAKRGVNLFHSFERFNVNANRVTTFANPNGVENIISRVTGNNRSEILGTLGVLGSAKLFLINPNGIIFGPSARLQVGGSFAATTANAIGFGDRGFWSASAPNSPSLLTVNPTALLFNQIANQPIVNQSTAGLRLSTANQSLVLVGGDVNLSGGRLQAQGGRIELGGLAEVGTVGLSVDSNNIRLFFPQDVQQANVSLTNKAIVDVRYNRGSSGDIQISGKRVTLNGSSEIVADNLESKPGGTLTITASDLVEVSGGSRLSVENYGIGTGGNLTIETRQLIVKDGALLTTGTFNSGSGGSTSITASEFVELSGISADGKDVSSILTQTDGSGNAGSVRIDTGRLIVTGGARISTSTTNSGQGGTLSVRATESVQLSGTSTSADNPQSSGLLAVATQSASGKPGDLTIETKQLIVRDGARVTASNLGESSSGGKLSAIATEFVQLMGTSADGLVNSGLFVGTSGNGAAGELTIETGKLLLSDGAVVSARTLGKEQGGNIMVNASNSVELASTSINHQPSRLTTETTGTEDAGNLTIATRQLSIKDGAQITSSSTGSGSAGDVKVDADTLRLNGGRIISQTTSGNGGNITLSLKDLLALRRGSQISSSAGTAQVGGDGGNIKIDSRFIIAVLKENSNISANAFTGRGGRVDITTRGIFGIEPRLRETPLSDITASSEFGINGEVIITELDIDPSNELVELPINLVDASKQIATGCDRDDNKKNSFTAIGRGGVAPSPTNVLMGDAVLAEWVTRTSENGTTESREEHTSALSRPAQIVEASDWIVDNNGDIVLVATAPNSSTLPTTSCSGS